jgi:hypothetical protein
MIGRVELFLRGIVFPFPGISSENATENVVLQKL